MRFTHLIIGLLAAGMALPAAADAETFLDLYSGAVLPGESDFRTTVGPATARGRTDFKDSFTFGGRIGFWFNGLPYLGLALDASHARLEEDADAGAEVDVVPISLLLMLRAPLFTTPAFPRGRVQPYVGAGPALFYTDFDANLSPALGTVSETAWDVGFDARAGLTLLLNRHIGLFGEYSYKYFKPEWEGTVVGLPASTRVEFNNHHVVGGLTFRFR